MLSSKFACWSEMDLIRFTFEAENMSLMDWSLTFGAAYSIGLEVGFGSWVCENPINSSFFSKSIKSEESQTR